MLLSVPSPSTLVQNLPPQSWFDTQTVKSEFSERSYMALGRYSDQVESKIEIKKTITHLGIIMMNDSINKC